MPTIDDNGALHDSLGRYAEQNKPAAGYDLGATPASMSPPAWAASVMEKIGNSDIYRKLGADAVYEEDGSVAVYLDYDYDSAYVQNKLHNRLHESFGYLDIFEEEDGTFVISQPEGTRAGSEAEDPDPSATDQVKRHLAAEATIGGPESMTAAKVSLWRTTLWADGPDLYGEEDDEGFHECYLCGAESPSGEIDAHMRNNHPQYTAGLTHKDIDPESKAKVEADFEAWAADNAEHVKAFTETVDDPDGGDPAEFLAHNWWLTRNGHGAGFKDRLADDPAYVEALRETGRRRLLLADTVGVVRDNNARVKAGVIGAESDLVRADHELEKITGSHVTFEKDARQPGGGNWVAHVGEHEYRFETKGEAQRHTAETAIYDITPMRVLREKMDRDSDLANEAAKAEMRAGNRGDAEAARHARDSASQYTRAAVTAHDALRRAEALTALDKATPTREYEVYVGGDGKVHVS